MWPLEHSQRAILRRLLPCCSTHVLCLAPYPCAPPLHEVFADDFAFLVRLLVGFVMVTPPVTPTTILLGTQSVNRKGNEKGGWEGPYAGQVETVSE